MISAGEMDEEGRRLVEEAAAVIYRREGGSRSESFQVMERAKVVAGDGSTSLWEGTDKISGSIRGGGGDYSMGMGEETSMGETRRAVMNAWVVCCMVLACRYPMWLCLPCLSSTTTLLHMDRSHGGSGGRFIGPIR